MTADIQVDAKGLACPMPIVKAKKTLEGMETGQILQLLSTDKGSVNDFQAWVRQTNHELIKHEEANGVYSFFIKKG